MALPLLDQQVLTRFGERNYIRLDTLDEDDTRDFIESLLAEWVDPDRRTELLSEFGSEAEGEDVTDETFPFTKPALEVAAAYACRNGGFTTPRDIQQSLDDLLNHAIDDSLHVLSDSYVQGLVNG